jgi:hypothetical protein
MADLVVVLIVKVLDVRAQKSETDTPVATHGDGPSDAPVTSQRVQAKAGQGHVTWFSGSTESAQDQSQFAGMLRLDSGRASTQEEALQTLVTEAEYGHASIVTRNVSGYNDVGSEAASP